MTGPGYLVVAEPPPSRFHCLLCVIGYAYHLTGSVMTPFGSAWRCKACKKAAATAGELIGIDDEVTVPS